MKAKDFAILMLIVILSLIIFIQSCGRNPKPKEVLNQHKYDSLQSEIIKKNNTLAALRIENERLVKQSDSLIKLIHTNEKSRDTLWLSHPDKRAAIKSLSATELERKLSERFDH